MADHDHEPPVAPSTLVHPLRLVFVLSYLPSIPLGITHGVLSHKVVPALGLLPLTASAATAIAAYRLREKIAEIDEERRQQAEEADVPHADDEEEAADSQLYGEDTETGTAAAKFRAAITHPVTVFAFDVVLAAATMIVLVFTWVDHGHRSNMSMLAAYATIPLLVNFFVHLTLAFRGLAHGFAFHGLVQYTAWHALPPDCPHCNVRLRPSSLPELPWLKSLQQSRRARAAARSSRQDYAPVFVDDQDRYRDDVESGGRDTPAETEEDRQAPQPDAVDVTRKDRKGKAAADSPWGA